MGLLRWIFRLLVRILWPWHRRKDDEERPARRRNRRRSDDGHPGVYRIEVDHELGRFHGESYAFSFWSSSRIILILSLLLWWIQPAGPMIAGYVGGRRAGAPWKAVVAALLPVAVILLANYAYTHNVAARQIDFVASLPLIVGDGVASVLPFLAPYRDFMVAYLSSFVEALRTTFGMGTNGYLMVVLFAYIGGLIGEQTRRELTVKQGTSQSVGLNFLTPFFHPRHAAYADDEGPDEDVESDEDEAPRRHRRPARAGGVGAKARGRKSGRRGPTPFEQMRKLSAEMPVGRGGRRSARARHRDDEEDEDQADEEPVEGRARRSRAHDLRRERVRDEEPDERARPSPEKERHAPKPRSREEEIAIQRFVERALRNYDKSRL